VNFLIQVPIAITLGFGKPAPDLMEHQPRPLHQPILSRAQWIRVVAIGILMAIATIIVEAGYEADGTAVAATMGFVVFSLFNIALGFMSRSETTSAFNRDIVSDRRQLGLVAAAFLLTVLPTEIDFLQRMLGLTDLSGYQWLIALGLALGLILVDEVVKIFMRRPQRGATTNTTPRPAVAV
jgi:Ca2+-transporting ATPase